MSRCTDVISGVGGHIPNHRVRVAAHGVQLGVRIVLRDTPDPVALVPKRRPARVLGQEGSDLGGSVRGGEVDLLRDEYDLAGTPHFELARQSGDSAKMALADT